MELGKRFSLLYLDRSKTLRDSQRFRNRLAAFYWKVLHQNHEWDIVQAIQLEIGAEVPLGMESYSVHDFIKQSELRDLLDSITVVYKIVKGGPYISLGEKWKSFVGRAISEENLGYRLDDECGVHFFVDEEFERNRFSTLAVLEDPQYSGSRGAYETAYKYLDADPIDTKGAVRSIFESIEILVKQMVDTKLLNKWVVENTLKIKCLTTYESDPIAKNVASKMFDGFGQWVDSVHNYRHGQVGDEPVSPPENIAIYIISSGTAFLRWLVCQNNVLLSKSHGDVSANSP
jgi:hypothetical protein